MCKHGHGTWYKVCQTALISLGAYYWTNFCGALGLEITDHMTNRFSPNPLSVLVHEVQLWQTPVV